MHPRGCHKVHQLSFTNRAFGNAAVLQLRLNKVSELIHNSTNHKNLAMARVCVHFQEIVDTVSMMSVKHVSNCCKCFVCSTPDTLLLLFANAGG